MCKKVLIASLAILAGVALLSSTRLGSHVRLWWKKANVALQKQVPVETEIERLRMELTRLQQDERRYNSALAEEMVAVDSLKEQIADAEAVLKRKKDRLLTMRNALKNDGERVSINGNEYDRAKVEKTVLREYDSFKSAQRAVKAQKDLLAAREKGLVAARERVKAMKETKRDLEVELARLEAEMKAVRVAQTRSKFNFDDSKLSSIKRDVQELQKRVKVEQKKIELEAENTDVIDTTPKPKTADRLKELDRELGNGADKVAGR